MTLKIIKVTDKKNHKNRYDICKKCPKFNKIWKTCKECGCFMPLKTKIRWAECPDGHWR